MKGWHIVLVAMMCMLLTVMAFSLSLNWMFINGKLKMQQPDAMGQMLDELKPKDKKAAAR